MTIKEINMKRDELISRLNALSDEKGAFYGSGQKTPNYNLWKKHMIKTDPIGMESVVIAMESKDIEISTTRNGTEASEQIKRDSLVAIKAKLQNKTASMDEIQEALSHLL